MAKSKAIVPDMGPAIARLREIAADSGDRLLLAGGVPNPDAALLDLCAEIAHQRKVAEEAEKRYRNNTKPYYEFTAADKADHALRQQEADAASRSFAHLLRKASNLRATTAAGIYAKALAVRSSRTGAATLAMSLAEDLIACPGLRASLWPSEAEVAP